MKRIFRVCLITITGLIAVFNGPGTYTSAAVETEWDQSQPWMSEALDNGGIQATELVIKYKDEPVYSKEAFRREKKLNVQRYTLQSGESLPQALHKWNNNPEVDYVEPNYIRKASLTPNDPALSNQWAISNLNMAEAWGLTVGNSDITVAVLDTGIDFNHPEFQGKIIPGYNFVQPGALPVDDGRFSHGTFVSAIIAANTNNAVGMAGMSWNASIMPLKILDREGYGTSLDVANAIYYAVDHGAKIINMSFGGPYLTITERNAINYALSKNVILVAASGNENNRVSYPAAYPGIIAVGAIDSNNQRASFSNYGYELDVVAPGVGIYSAVAGGGYVTANGTSFAAPHVAGLVALLLSQNEQLTPVDVEYILESTANDLGQSGYDKDYGYGLIQPVVAIQQAFPPARDQNDTKLQAAVIPPDRMKVEQTIAYPGDVDWYSFQVNQQTEFRWNVTAPAPIIPKVTLFNGSMQTVYDRASTIPGDQISQTVTLQPGIYYFRVQDHPQYQNFSMQPYSLVIENLQFMNISGAISLENRTSFEGTTVRIPSLELETITDERGNFVFEAIPRGDYTVEVVHEPFLKKRINVLASNPGFIEEMLLLGDLNQDETIDLYDLVLVTRLIGISGAAANHPLIDLNADGVIDLSDTESIIRNYIRR